MLTLIPSINKAGTLIKTGKKFKEGTNISKQNAEHLDRERKVYYTENQEDVGNNFKSG